MKLPRRRSLLLVAAGVSAGLAICWMPLLGLALFAVAFLRWVTLRASGDREWSPEYAESPWAEISGDEVVIHNFRNCRYRSRTDPIPHWESKTVHLSKLRGIDFFLNSFGSVHVGHTLLSFDFGDEGYVCTSIEARRERGETYSLLGGMLRQYELYYVFGDERDLLRLRTEYRHQAVYLYRLAEANPETYRALFLAYLLAANELRAHPRWYHAAIDNCTTNIVKNARTSGFAATWDWRFLLNGRVDELLYERGIIPQALSFAETKAKGWINERARAAGDAADFSARIRQSALRSEAVGALQSTPVSGNTLPT